MRVFIVPNTAHTKGVLAVSKWESLLFPTQALIRVFYQYQNESLLFPTQPYKSPYCSIQIGQISPFLKRKKLRSFFNISHILVYLVPNNATFCSWVQYTIFDSHQPHIWALKSAKILNVFKNVCSTFWSHFFKGRGHKNVLMTKMEEIC